MSVIGRCVMRDGKPISANVAFLRLMDVVHRDRDAVPCWRWARDWMWSLSNEYRIAILGAREYWRISGASLMKPRYRWERRR